MKSNYQENKLATTAKRAYLSLASERLTNVDNAKTTEMPQRRLVYGSWRPAAPTEYGKYCLQKERAYLIG